MKKNVCFILILSFLVLLFNVGIAQEISLKNLTAFNTPARSWQIQGDVFVNPLREGSFQIEKGKGILVGITPDDTVSSITTKKNYGDLVLEFDILVAHDASATLWLQGRYGLIFADSWKAKKINNTINGAVIPPNTKGTVALGYLPRMNVERAPGTWQHVKIVFEAPHFGSDGHTIRPARLVSFQQNGVVIQENQYLPALSNGSLLPNEGREGPIGFQVGSGQIAIKNLEVTEYGGGAVQLEELFYRLYLDKFLDDEFIYWGVGEGDRIPLPDLTGRQPDEQGSIDQLNTRMVRGKGNELALTFTGNLKVPKNGRYTFEIVPNGLGSFELDGEEQVRWNALHNKGKITFTVDLQKGNHAFRQLYVNYGQPRAGLFIEGPGIRRQALHQGGQIPRRGSTEPILLKPGNKPLIQRSFLYYEDRKLLTGMSVGSPEGVHYSYNMATGGLVQAWRGPFADATPMWHGRGARQVLKPLGSVLQLTSDQQVHLQEAGSTESGNHSYQRNGYSLGANGYPIFRYAVGFIRVREQIRPQWATPTLKRTLRFTNAGGQPQSVLYRVASAGRIEQIDENLYSIGDRTYFVQIDRKVQITQEGATQQLVVPLQVGSQPQQLTYSIIW